KSGRVRERALCPRRSERRWENNHSTLRDALEENRRGNQMTELTSQQLADVILRGLAEARADILERQRLPEGRNLSPVTERALAGLTASEVAQVIKDLSQNPTS